MQIGSSMDEAEFRERVVPCVSKLFTSTDRSIRRSLLENIDAYGKHLSQVPLAPPRPPPPLPLAKSMIYAECDILFCCFLCCLTPIA